MNSIPIDLHCHTDYSDGAHSYQEVLDLVKANHGKFIAITDHDNIDSIIHAKKYALSLGLHLISGVEISVTWQENILIHIIGLNFNENDSNLINNLNKLRAIRFERGIKISQQFDKIGIPNSLDGALKFCRDKNSLSRTHFARFLIENGYAKPNNVFNKFLTKGKTGYIPQIWASLSDAISWITSSGGVAIIAHPARYKLNHSKLEALINDFKKFGGIGIEVISSSHLQKDTLTMAQIAKQHNLYASLGTDFHNIKGYPRVTVGINPTLPKICKPIYELLGIKLT